MKTAVENKIFVKLNCQPFGNIPLPHLPDIINMILSASVFDQEQSNFSPMMIACSKTIIKYWEKDNATMCNICML